MGLGAFLTSMSLAATVAMGGLALQTPDPAVSQRECEEGGGHVRQNAAGELECWGGAHDGSRIIGFGSHRGI